MSVLGRKISETNWIAGGVWRILGSEAVMKVLQKRGKLRVEKSLLTAHEDEHHVSTHIVRTGVRHRTRARVCSGAFRCARQCRGVGKMQVLGPVRVWVDAGF